MSYLSVDYLFLFVVLVIIYNLTPKKIKPIILLIASYAFFFYISGELVFYLLLSSISIYGAGLIMKKIDGKRDEKLEKTSKEERKTVKEKYKRRKRIVLVFTILFNVAFLFFFKYLNFFKKISNKIFSIFNINHRFSILKYAAPIGISFYTLQALSYVIDVYNEKIEADKNIFKVFLYLSFFPTIMEGPITRYGQVSDSIYNGSKVTYHNFCFGFQRILWGFFKKFLIADRLNAVVKVIFKGYMHMSGASVALGAIAYTIMLYMEFSGTMDVVIGSAEVFDIKIPENFRQPFFAKNITDFWSRWHISLGTWLKDYIFYPVSLSKPVKKLTTFLRKHINNRVSSLVMGAIALFAVWSLNGLWHGAGYNFLAFGYYHFVLILLGNIFEPTIVKICEKLKINRKSTIYKGFQIVKTSLLVFLGEIFFRAINLTTAIQMIKRIFLHFDITSIGSEIPNLGLDVKDFIVIVVALIVVLIVSILKEHNKNIREDVSKKHIVLRWAIYYALIFGILIFGAYGPGYEPVDPIYADF